MIARTFSIAACAVTFGRHGGRNDRAGASAAGASGWRGRRLCRVSSTRRRSGAGRQGRASAAMISEGWSGSEPPRRNGRRWSSTWAPAARRSSSTTSIPWCKYLSHRVRTEGSSLRRCALREQGRVDQAAGGDARGGRSSDRGALGGIAVVSRSGTDGTWTRRNGLPEDQVLRLCEVVTARPESMTGVQGFEG